MIRRLTLRDWRAYEQVDLKLEPGTTFVVARNGLGKTSLIEGATWALFGDTGRRPQGAVRIGSSTASATIEAELPDGSVLSVTRDLPSTFRAKLPAAVATLNGQSLPAHDVDDVVRSAFAAEPAFLSRLAMLQSRDRLDPPSELNLSRHLCSFFGIDGLQEALTQLDARLKATDRAIREIKKGTSAGNVSMRALRGGLQAANQAAVVAEEAHAEAAEAARQADEILRTATAAAELAVQAAQRQERLESIAAAVADLLEVPVLPQGLVSALQFAEEDAARSLDVVRREHALLAARQVGLDAALHELDDAHGTCPVCTRPLSPEDAEAARHTHERERSALIDGLTATAAREEAIEARQRSLAEWRRAADRLVDSNGDIREAIPPLDTDAATAAAVEAHARQSEAFEGLVAKRSSLLTAQAALTTAEQDERASAMLRQEHASYAVALTARAAIAATVGTLLTGTISPLADAVGDRWKRLFGDRGPVTLESDGDVTRRVNGERLPFASFSTGEQMGLQLILRLLTLGAATRGTFCWIDEPLEHLDPDARRHVASLLARAPQPTGIRQVVVTTYEGPLARRLAERTGANVHLLYVRGPRGQ